MSNLITMATGVLFVVLYAVALRFCIRLVAPERASENSLGRALAVATGLSLLSVGLSAIGGAPTWLSALIIFGVWIVVVSWAYRLDLPDTIVVAVAMLIISVLGVVCLDLLISLTVS